MLIACCAVQQNVAGLYDLLQLWRGHASERDAVVMAEINHRIAMHIRGDERLQFLSGLYVGEVVEFERVLTQIEIGDGVGADAGREHEIIVAGSADGDRYSLAHIRGRILRVCEAHVIGLGDSLGCAKVGLSVSE